MNNQTQMKPEEGVGKEPEIYSQRFTPAQERTRSATWQKLCSFFFQQFIPENATVVDLGAGDGLFISNIKAKRRIAIDLSPHVKKLESHGIEVYLAPATEFTHYFSDKADVVFMSNFLEHLPSRSTVLRVFEECHRALKPGGKILILQPNIRYVGAAYWDYIDHHIALTEYSLVEGLTISGFRVEKLIPKFLPYTAKSGLGSIIDRGNFQFLIDLYLRTPLLWKIFGKQTFVLASADK